jgi:uncharacterized protein (UPF0548 family)
MVEWRIGKGWTEEELEKKLDILPALKRNFSEPAGQMTNENGWQQYYSEAVIARGKPGLPEENGLFERGRKAVANYEFSDPRIVIAHFDPDTPLPERHMLLEMRAFRILHYLSGVVVGAVCSEQSKKNSIFGFRYDTLEGHIEKGTEWFLLTKEHETGEIRMRVEASWRPGQFPNWWSRFGFSLVGPHYQERWHRLAHRRMARIVHRSESHSLNREEGRLVHTDPDVVFKRKEAEANK